MMQDEFEPLVARLLLVVKVGAIQSMLSLNDVGPMEAKAVTEAEMCLLLQSESLSGRVAAMCKNSMTEHPVDRSI